MKERLDKIVFSRGLLKSRETARAFIIEGKVLVDGKKITKPGTQISETAEILLKESDPPFAGRGGLKLDAALAFFAVEVKDKIVMDVGSSTGGFTDCLLQRGAGKVYCIDVGYGQLAWRLRIDPRVVVVERTNIRYLDSEIEEHRSRFEGSEFKDLLNGNIDMATIDVSFISLTKVIPPVMKFLTGGGEVLALVKPQFEVGKGEVGKGGIVREEEKRLSAVGKVRDYAEGLGLQTVRAFQCPVPGQKGNIEYFLYMKMREDGR